MQKFEIKTKNNRARSGHGWIRIRLLEHLSVDTATAWQKALQQIANSYNSGDVIRKFSVVSDLWLDCHKADPTMYPIPPVPEASAHHLIKNLRRAWYERELIKRKNRFITANLRWGTFIGVFRRLANVDLFPLLNFDAKVYRPVPNRNFHLIRNQARIGTLADSVIPTSFDLESDSYHDSLLIPLSLHRNDNDYLIEYENRLATAIDSFESCALIEFKQFKEQYQSGHQILASVDYKRILDLINSRKTNKKIKHFDPETGYHLFLPDGGHPNVFANLLAMVEYEMGGIPKPCKIIRNGQQISIGPRRWRYLRDFGKNRLLPYLGILTSRSAIPLIVLLLLEHPRINVESLINARLEDRYGQVILFSKAGEQSDDIRFTVDKPRANSQKHAVLTDIGREVFRFVLCWTEKVRKELRASGHEDEANYLWLGLTDSSTYNIGRLMPDPIRSAFRQANYTKNFTDEQRKDRKPFNNRGEPDFIRSHPNLTAWENSANFYQLRVSRGVLDWFKSGGDLVVAARTFGHRSIRTTIENYIPKPVQDALYERQIRRWQNLLISASCSGRSYLLAATDFSTMDLLHEFLIGIFDGDELQIHSDSGLFHTRLHQILDPEFNINTKDIVSINSDKKVFLINDSDCLAVAFLYREHLLEAATGILDTPDNITLCTPRMWLDLTNALQVKLPDTYFELSNLVSRAHQRVEEIRDHTHFFSLNDQGHVNA